MDKIGTGVVETGREDQCLATWCHSPLPGDSPVDSAPLSIIWKPQVCRTNSKFFDFIIANLSYFLCCPSLWSKWVHPPVKEFSQRLQCAFFSDPPWYLMLPEWAPPGVRLVSSHSLFKTWRKWNLLVNSPLTVTWLLLSYISPLEQSSVQYYNLRFSWPYSLQTWSCWVVILCSFHLCSSRT